MLENHKKEGMFFKLLPKGEKHTEAYVYKDEYLENIIKYSIGEAYDEEKFLQWVHGKIFGYADHEIRKFIERGHDSLEEKS